MYFLRPCVNFIISDNTAKYNEIFLNFRAFFSSENNYQTARWIRGLKQSWLRARVHLLQKKKKKKEERKRNYFLVKPT